MTQHPKILLKTGVLNFATCPLSFSITKSEGEKRKETQLEYRPCLQEVCVQWDHVINAACGHGKST